MIMMIINVTMILMMRMAKTISMILVMMMTMMAAKITMLPGTRIHVLFAKSGNGVFEGNATYYMPFV